MADVIGMSDISSPDTGKGSVLKTGGGRRKYNVKKRKSKMPSKSKCKNWKKLGYKSEKDCTSYGKKKKKTAIEFQLEKTMEKQSGKKFT